MSNQIRFRFDSLFKFIITQRTSWETVSFFENKGIEYQ